MAELAFKVDKLVELFGQQVTLLRFSQKPSTNALCASLTESS